MPNSFIAAVSTTRENFVGSVTVSIADDQLASAYGWLRVLIDHVEIYSERGNSFCPRVGCRHDPLKFENQVEGRHDRHHGRALDNIYPKFRDGECSRRIYAKINVDQCHASLFFQLT